MPGYTHTQQAMPSSVGQWAGSFVESLLDDVSALAAAIQMNDQNPLGSAAGFGTALPIDRDYTSKLLGFSRTQINSLYCQNSRGKIESFTVAALLQVMMTLGKIANDLIWFTSREFGFFKVDVSLTTGSSIMPQKRNLDIMEVLRANVSVIMANQMQIQSAGHNLLSGYNKDLKITKKALMDSFEITESGLDITKLLFKNLEPNKERLKESFSSEIFATDEANKLALKGVPFRDAYRQIGESLKKVKAQDAEKNIRSKKHIGATGNLKLEIYQEKIKKL
jgi:argininosuccinate lyase